MSVEALPLPLRLIQSLRRSAPAINQSLRRLLLAIYVSAFVLTVASLFAKGEMPLNGNIHDIFIWVNAALFIDSGLRPHVDFSSPLGALYLYANAAAWRLTDNVGEMPIIVGIGFAIALGILLLGYRRYLRRWLLPEALAIIMLLALSGRQMGEVKANLTWYGSYNRLCWIAIFVFVFVILGRNAVAVAPSQSDRLRIAALAGFLLGLIFFIKINFFVALCVIYGGWLFASDAYRDLRAWAVPAMMFVVWVAGAALLGVDIAGYLQDLTSAAMARDSSEAIGLIKPVAFVLAAVLVLANVIADWVIGNWTDLRRRLILYVGLSGGLVFALAGDFATPLEVFLIVLAYRLLDALPSMMERPDRELLAALAATALIVFGSLLFVALEMYSVFLTSIHKITHYSPARSQSIAWSQSGPSAKTIRLRVPHPRAESDYSLVAEIVDRSAERPQLLRAISGLRGEAFKLYNKTYVAQVEEGRAVMMRQGLPAGRILFPLEFSNPYGFLLGTRPPAGALLWYHDGTTFNGDLAQSLDPVLDNSEFVLVPHVTVDPQMRVVLNGMFERYNARTLKFCEFHTGLYWSFYKRCQE